MYLAIFLLDHARKPYPKDTVSSSISSQSCRRDKHHPGYTPYSEHTRYQSITAPQLTNRHSDHQNQQFVLAQQPRRCVQSTKRVIHSKVTAYVWCVSRFSITGFHLDSRWDVASARLTSVCCAVCSVQPICRHKKASRPLFQLEKSPESAP